MRSELDLMKEKKDQIWTRREKEENKKRTKMNEKRNIEMNLTENEPVSEAANYAT